MKGARALALVALASAACAVAACASLWGFDDLSTGLLPDGAAADSATGAVDGGTHPDDASASTHPSDAGATDAPPGQDAARVTEASSPGPDDGSVTIDTGVSEGGCGGCATAACCGTSCATQHSNGVGGYYYDCVPLGTYNATQATEAANSDTAQTGTLSTGWACGSSPNTSTSVCKTANASTGTCSCWVYAATGNLVSTIGTVYVNTQSGTTNGGCYCPGTGAPTWN